MPLLFAKVSSKQQLCRKKGGSFERGTQFLPLVSLILPMVCTTCGGLQWEPWAGPRAEPCVPERQKEAIEARLLQQKSSSYFGGLPMCWQDGIRSIGTEVRGRSSGF